MKTLNLVRLGLLTLAGVFIGGIIHVVVVLGVPAQVPDLAYERIGRFGADEGFIRLPPIAAGSETLAMLDPAMTHAACRYQLETGPVRLEATIPAPFWSFALFNRRGETIYSFNDRTSGTGRLTMLVLTSDQLSRLREQPPENLEDMIVIETEAEEGFALLRAFIPDALRRSVIETSLEEAVCRKL